MDKSSGVMLITQTRVKPDKNNEFLQWLDKMSVATTKSPGFVSETISRPNPPVQLHWVIIQHFASSDAAQTWLLSNERKELLKEGAPLFLTGGLDNVYLVEDTKYKPAAVVTTVSTIIKPEDEQRFLDWNARIGALEFKYPGFSGHRLERPRPGVNDAWITIVTFDSNEHLEAWLQSEERKKLVEELNTFSVSVNTAKAYSGFDFWFTGQEAQGSAWKENMLVLLALYPVVFLLSFIQGPIVNHQIMPFWLALFFSNAASTAILGWIAVPWLMKHFAWWIKPPLEAEKKNTMRGTFIVITLYVMSLLIAWLLSKI